MSRREDFFGSELGSQAAVMNARMLWHKDETWSAKDLQNAIPEIPLSAIRGHFARLSGDHPTRGGFIIQLGKGVYGINHCRCPK